MALPAALIATVVAVTLPAGASLKEQSVTAYPGAATHATRAIGLNDTQSGPNWAGFVASGTKFRYVEATFRVPRVNCHMTPGTTRVPAMAADWVGIDGFNENNPTVEQDGVSAQCVNGAPSYGVWYEMFPKPPVYPNSVNFGIGAGNLIKVSVWYSPGNHKYRLVFSNLSTGAGFTIWQRCPIRSCQNASVEVITESPAMSASTNSKYFPLADIGTSTFRGIKITDMAGQRGGFSDGNWSTTRLVMTGKGGRLKASTSGLAAGGTAFSTYWEHAN